MPPLDPDDVRMSLGDHLEELRKRLFLGAIGPVIFAILLMFIAHDLVSFLCRPLLQALDNVGASPGLYAPRVYDSFGVYLRVALIGGVILGIPWLLWHLWMFIAPGLYARERRFIVALLPGSAVLAVTGAAFMYYVMLPFTLWFLIGFAAWFPMPDYTGGILGAPEVVEIEENDLPPPMVLPRLTGQPSDPSEGSMWVKVPENQLWIYIAGQIRKIPLESASLVTPQLHIVEYITFVMWLGLAFALAFQLPLAMLGLGFTGLVTRRGLARVRKYAYFTCFLVGAFLTPGDVPSMLALALPLCILYEFGLLLMRFFVAEEPEEAA